MESWNTTSPLYYTPLSSFLSHTRLPLLHYFLLQFAIPHTSFLCVLPLSAYSRGVFYMVLIGPFFLVTFQPWHTEDFGPCIAPEIKVVSHCLDLVIVYIKHISSNRIHQAQCLGVNHFVHPFPFHDPPILRMVNLRLPDRNCFIPQVPTR